MKKIRFAALAMAAAMLMTMLASCSAEKKNRKVVKEDDPWYDSVKFKLDKDVRANDDVDTGVCTSSDNIFALYCASGDTWGSSRTVLDMYDFEGSMVSRQEVSLPDNLYVQRIYALRADNEGGKLNAVLQVNSPGRHGAVFADIDTKTGIVSNIEDLYSGKAKKAKGTSYSTDIISFVGDYTVVLLMGDIIGGVSGWKLMLFKDKEYVTELDLSAVSILYFFDGFSIDESAGSLYAAGFEAGGAVVSMEFDLRTGQMKNHSNSQGSNDNKINLAEYTATNNGELCKIDSLGNIMKVDVNTMTPETVIDTNWYTPYFSSLNTEGYGSYSWILSCTGERTVILGTESRAYSDWSYFYYNYITVLTKAEKNPHAGKEIIELALPSKSEVSGYLASAVFEFNKTDDEYLIRVWDKSKTGYTLGRIIETSENGDAELYGMIQELKGDEAPDIAVGIQKNYAMRDDVFMDITGFLDQEVMDKQFGNIFEAGRINGKLYFLPVTLEIEGLVIDSELLKDGAAGLTFDEYDKLVKEDLNGFSPYDYPYSEAYNKRSFLLSCIDTKSAIDGDKIEFGTDQFRKAAEYAKDNFQYDDLSSTPSEYLFDIDTRERSKCYYAKISDYIDFVHACYKSDGHYVIIGTPSEDATGPRFKALETISVSATTDVKEGCRKFLNYLFSGTAFSSGDCDFLDIVTNKEIMNKNIETLSKHNNDAYDSFLAAEKSAAIIVPANVKMANGDKYATDDMRESFLNSMSTISTYNYEDTDIVRFVMEEIAPYYAGDRSLDDVVRYLNDRVSKYVREM